MSSSGVSEIKPSKYDLDSSAIFAASNNDNNGYQYMLFVGKQNFHTDHVFCL